MVKGPRRLAWLLALLAVLGCSRDPDFGPGQLTGGVLVQHGVANVVANAQGGTPYGVFIEFMDEFGNCSNGANVSEAFAELYLTTDSTFPLRTTRIALRPAPKAGVPLGAAAGIASVGYFTLARSNARTANTGSVEITASTTSEIKGTLDAFFALPDGGSSEVTGSFDAPFCGVVP